MPERHQIFRRSTSPRDHELRKNIRARALKLLVQAVFLLESEKKLEKIIFKKKIRKFVKFLSPKKKTPRKNNYLD